MAWKSANEMFAPLRQAIEAEMEREVGQVLDVDSFPCQYADPSDPHPLIEEGDFKCDGFGNMMHQSTGCMRSKRCRCFLSHRERKLRDGYCDRLPEHVAMEVKGANPKAFGLGMAIGEWGFKTNGLLLAGKPGTGKTIAGHRIMLEWIERRNVSAVAFSSEKIADENRRYGLGDPSEKEQMARRILARDELAMDPRTAFFLDDLGRSRESQSVIEEIRGIIRKRYEINGILVVTTNLDGKALRETYGSDIVDRILDRRWMTIVKLDIATDRNTLTKAMSNGHWQDD